MHQDLRAWLSYLHRSAVSAHPNSAETQMTIHRDRLTTDLNSPAVLSFYASAQQIHSQWIRRAVSDYEALTHDQINQYWRGPESSILPNTFTQNCYQTLGCLLNSNIIQQHAASQEEKNRFALQEISYLNEEQLVSLGQYCDRGLTGSILRQWGYNEDYTLTFKSFSQTHGRALDAIVEYFYEANNVPDFSILLRAFYVASDQAIREICDDLEQPPVIGTDPNTVLGRLSP